MSALPVFYAMPRKAVEGEGVAEVVGEASMSAATPSAALVSTSTKLLDFAHGKLHMARATTTSNNNSAVQVLQRLDLHTPLNLVHIFGNARSGKSFLMNCLSGIESLFTVINSSTPCTRGVDLATFIPPLTLLDQRAHDIAAVTTFDERERADLDSAQASVEAWQASWQRHQARTAASVTSAATAATSAASTAPPSSPSPPSPPVPHVAYVDVEGQGAEDGTYDTMLALPLLLTSRVVLFNHKGAPTVNDMLSKLGVLARAADYIDTRDNADENNVDEDGDGGATNAARSAVANGNDGVDGDDDGRPAPGLSRQPTYLIAGRKKFGHLHVLFRDFSFEGDRQSVYDQLMAFEPLQKVKRAPKSFNAHDRDRGGGARDGSTSTSDDDMNRAIQERNDIRQLLLDNFESIHVWLFKQPASADDLRAHKSLPAHLIDPSFQRTVNVLLLLMALQLRTPTTFHGVTLTGPSLVSMLTSITQSLNDKGLIHVPSVYRAMETATVERVRREQWEWFSTQLAAIVPRLPMRKQLLVDELHAVCQRTLDGFDGALATCNLDDEKRKKREALLVDVTKMQSDVLRDNHALLVDDMRSTCAAEWRQLRTRVDALCRTRMPVEDASEIEHLVENERETTWQRLQQQVREMEDDMVNEREFVNASLEWRDKSAELVAWKLVENENKRKERKIEAIQEEAQKHRAALAEQNERLEKYLADERGITKMMREELERLQQANAEGQERVRQLTESYEQRVQAVMEEAEEARRRVKEMEEEREKRESERAREEKERRERREEKEARRKESKCVVM